MGNYAFEYYGNAAVFPTESQTATGIEFGPTGADFTGSADVEATLANQTAILAAIAALPTSVPTPEQISIRIADDIFESDNGWDVAAEVFGVVTTTRVERLEGILRNTQTSVGTKPSAEQLQ